MIQFNPNDRINLNDIIHSNWLNSNLIDKNIIISEFKLREKYFIKHLENSKESSEENLRKYLLKHNIKYNNNNNLKDIKNIIKKKLTIKRIFKDDIIIPLLETQYANSNIFYISSLKIKPVDFVNCLANYVVEKINSAIKISPNNKFLRFIIYYDEKEINNKDDSLISENFICAVEVKFYEMEDNSYSIMFKKKFGEIFEFYEKVSEIKDIISELLISELFFEYI